MRDLWAVQRAANQVVVETSAQQTAVATSDISITNLCLTDMNLILTNGKTVSAYKIQRTSQDSIDQGLKSTSEITLNDNFTVRFSSSFACENINMFIYDQHVILIGQNDVIVMSLNGVKLQELTFTDHEGKPIGADLTSKYLTIFTLNGFIKIYDVSRHELKLLVPVKNAYDLFENFGEVIVAKTNHDGSLVAITIANETLIPDGKLYIWKLETDAVVSYDFLQKDNVEAIARLPITFNWDTDDSRLLACEAKLIPQSNKNSDITSLIESQVYVMFATLTNILEIEIIDLSSNEQLINLCAPNVICLKVGVIGQKILRDFIGLENTDDATRKMVLDFSLNVAQGNLDQAFFCIRSLTSEAVWHNLARMCVQTGRLDVAKICLGHLKKARSVRAVRKAMEDQTLENDAKTAVLAIELGMIDEAENLYKKCGRFDLLNQLLQNCGRFEEALKIAEQ
jgi:intraflagellar transport protein 140